MIKAFVDRQAREISRRQNRGKKSCDRKISSNRFRESREITLAETSWDARACRSASLSHVEGARKREGCAVEGRWRVMEISGGDISSGLSEVHACTHARARTPSKTIK